MFRSRLTSIASFLLCGCLMILPNCAAPTPCSLDSLPLVARAEWKAVEPNLNAVGEHGLYDAATNPDGWRVYDKPLPRMLNTIVVHHSALPLNDGPLEIQKMHLEAKGYADIGYHFLIDENGQMFRGRDLNVRGAHTGGFNTGTVGIVLLGNFEETTPTERQIESFKTLARCLTSAYSISHLAGHRDFQPTETVCPGAMLEPLLPIWASELNLKFGTDGYVPP